MTSIPTAQLTGLDMSGGVHTSMRRYAIYGFVVGSVIGGIAGYASFHPEECKNNPGCYVAGREAVGMLSASLGGTVGLLSGFMFGMRETERWYPMRTADLGHVRLHLGAAPGAGVSISASRTF